jgi:hypothetical protein
MSRTMLESEINAEALKSYAEDLVVGALRDGTISAAILLECIYHALEPDMLSAFRAFSALGTAERIMVMSYAKKLSEGEGLQPTPFQSDPS